MTAETDNRLAALKIKYIMIKIITKGYFRIYGVK